MCRNCFSCHGFFSAWQHMIQSQSCNRVSLVLNAVRGPLLTSHNIYYVKSGIPQKPHVRFCIMLHINILCDMNTGVVNNFSTTLTIKRGLRAQTGKTTLIWFRHLRDIPKYPAGSLIRFRGVIRVMVIIRFPRQHSFSCFEDLKGFCSPEACFDRILRQFYRIRELREARPGTNQLSQNETGRDRVKNPVFPLPETTVFGGGDLRVILWCWMMVFDFDPDPDFSSW